MGGGCSSTPKVVDNQHHRRAGKESQNPKKEEEDDIEFDDLSNEHIDQLLKLMQLHNLKRMTEEIKTDVHLFVLNNLLMSVQFFENFEKSSDAARDFKRKKESEINNVLAKGPQDGQIIGERKCHLIHGMGEILAQNYIYRPADRYVDIEDGLYASVQNRLDPSKSTFMCESILPLEFTMTWDNLEVHDSNQWDNLNGAPYESASGSPPIIRFCMEEPDEKNKVPKGYVRLRCVDLPIAMRPPLSLTHLPNHEQGYVYDYSEFIDKVSEARSDSDVIPESDDSSSIHEDFMEGLKAKVDQNQTTPVLNNNPLANLKTGNKMEFGKKVQIDVFPPKNEAFIPGRRDSGIKPIPKFNRGQLLKASSEITISVDPSTPKIEEENEFAFAEPNELDENANITNYQHLLPKPLSDRWSKSLPKLPSQTLYNDKSSRTREPNSSGYETGSQTSVASRSSSIGTLASEEVRDRWRSIELKSISDYPEKNRRKNLDKNYKPEPLAFNCFMNVKYEVESDDEGNEEEEDDSDTSDTSDDDDTKTVESVKMETRTYLNSSHFSADYCSEFHYIARRHFIPPGVVANAVVLGTTVRCAIPYKSDKYHRPDSDGEDSDDGSEDFSMLHTFTPCLLSKSWPKSIFFKFSMRMKNKRDRYDAEQWPSTHLVNQIDDGGCNVIPLGYRSIEFFNAQQCLEWKVNFAKAETFLLNTFQHVHWRAYIFSSLLYRAFLAPLGPQGLGLEHFRNILYFMCHEDFVGWNYEQPGIHVRALLGKLFECLGRCKMPSFFIVDHNMLKSIPPQNTRLVQAHLSKIRENLIVYFIYAFRNLTNIKELKQYYPMPQFDKLYKILTVPKPEDLLKIQTPGLIQAEENDEAMRKEIRKKNKKRNKKIQMDLIANEDKYEGEFRTHFVNKTHKPDKIQEKYRKKRKKFEENSKRDKERKKLEKTSDIIPETERRKSIDLECLPVVPGKFTQFRLVLVIEFFIKHFLEMARKSNEFRAYSQSAMYVLQVENLCALLRDPKINNGQNSVDEEDIKEFLSQTENLRQVIGGEMRSYVTSRINFNDSQNSNPEFAGELFGSNVFTGSAENWKLGKLPTPPESVHDDIPELPTDRKDSQTVKIFEAPKLAKSLQSIPSVSRKPTRTESIKFMDDNPNRPIVIKPKSYSRSTSQEPATMDDAEKFESTDL